MLLVASGINFVDLAGAHLLGQEAARRKAFGGGLYFFNLKQEPLDMLRRAGVFEQIGAHHFFKMGDDVIATLYQRLDRKVCAQCQVRIFQPCGPLPG